MPVGSLVYEKLPAAEPDPDLVGEGADGVGVTPHGGGRIGIRGHAERLNRRDDGERRVGRRATSVEHVAGTVVATIMAAAPSMAPPT